MRALGIATVYNNRIVLTQTQYRYRDLYKAIPGSQWDGQRWSYPLSPITAKSVFDLLGEEHVSPSVILYVNRVLAIPQIVSKTEPWRHQVEAFEKLYSLEGALLAEEMGCGKSRTAIDLMYAHGCDKVLILCPLSVVPVWPSEFAKHSAKAYQIVALDSGGVAKKTEIAERALELGVSTVLVINYESAWRQPFRKLALGGPWDMVVCDEIHKIKAAGGKASLFCRHLRDRAKYRLGLTGTPLPHSLLDAYAQYRFLDPAVFGTSYVRFRSRYAVMGGYKNHQVVGFQNTDEFNKRFYSIAYRVTADEVLDLPPTMHLRRVCQMPHKTRRTYNRLESEFWSWVESERKRGIVTISNALTKLLRLQQVTSGYVRTDEGEDVVLDEAKRRVLEEVFRELPQDEPVVVFCRFRHDLDQIRIAAERCGRAWAELSGRVKELDIWQGGEASILAAQIQAGSLGIDLTRAHYGVFYSVGFSLGDYLQALKRLDRPGQTKTVRYIHIVSQETVDEKVHKALESRKNIIEAILEREKEYDDFA